MRSKSVAPINPLLWVVVYHCPENAIPLVTGGWTHREDAEKQAHSLVRMGWTVFGVLTVDEMLGKLKLNF